MRLHEDSSFIHGHSKKLYKERQCRLLNSAYTKSYRIGCQNIPNFMDKGTCRPEGSSSGNNLAFQNKTPPMLSSFPAGRVVIKESLIISLMSRSNSTDCAWRVCTGRLNNPNFVCGLTYLKTPQTSVSPLATLPTHTSVYFCVISSIILLKNLQHKQDR